MPTIKELISFFCLIVSWGFTGYGVYTGFYSVAMFGVLLTISIQLGDVIKALRGLLK